MLAVLLLSVCYSIVINTEYRSFWLLLYTLMTKKEEQAVLIFERKIFRRICGSKYKDGEWKSRTNRELEEFSKGENIVKWIKGQRVS